MQLITDVKITTLQGFALTPNRTAENYGIGYRLVALFSK